MEKGYNLDFIGIGAPRCGTTWISRCLEEHPEICFSNRKELHFFNFDSRYNQGEEFISRYFTHCGNEKIRGEWSTYYLYSKIAGQRIKKDCPNAKLLISLRNPIERAYSHYLLRKYSASAMPLHGFRYSISDKDKYGYIKLGFYSEPLKYYLSVFPKENIHIVIYEEMTKEPAKHIKEIYKFLNVDDNFIPPSLGKNVDYRAQKKFRSLYVQSINNKLTSLYKQSWARNFLKYFMVRSLFRLIKNLNKRKIVKKFKKPPMPEDCRKRLTNIYRDEIKSLELLLNKKLDVWKQ